jgi:predicted nucleic acid-binding protein
LNGYLLDTNHVEALAKRNPKIVQKVQSLPPNTQVRTCTITLGEIEAGNLITITTDQQKRNQALAYINATFLPNALAVSHSTRIQYAAIISRIWQQRPPHKGSVQTESHLVSLGVNINDVWIVAVGWEHGLIIATTDKMEVIRKVVPEVQWDNWL